MEKGKTCKQKWIDEDVRERLAIGCHHWQAWENQALTEAMDCTLSNLGLAPGFCPVVGIRIVSE